MRFVTYTVYVMYLSAALFMTGCASFELETNQEGVSIIDEQGNSIGMAPYNFEQFSGERVFTLKKPGYVDKKITISSLDKKDIDVDLELVKETVLNTVPTDVRVVRTGDSRELGRTSLKLIISSPEVVLLEKDGYKPVPLTLEPNQTYKISMEALEGFKSVNFTSKPTGASISDRSVGDFIANTPARISAEEGTEFEFKLDGYQSSYYMINKRSPGRVFVELIPVPRITIDSLFGSEIFGAAGGEKLGEVPYTELIKEVRAFEVRKAGYYPKTVTLSPDSPPDIYVKLEPIPMKRIITIPEGATVSRIGKEEVIGEAPMNILVGSERLIEVYMEGYARRVVGIGPDSPDEITIELDPLAKDRLVIEGIQNATFEIY